MHATACINNIQGVKNQNPLITITFGLGSPWFLDSDTGGL